MPYIPRIQLECTNKVRHTSMGNAKREAARLSAEKGTKVNAYKCDFCRMYHVGNASLKRKSEEGK